eukprot:COSAG06_NODE_6965_length_2671_cov_1.977649_5_plen_109_part_00
MEFLHLTRSVLADGLSACLAGCACRWRSNGGDLEAKRDLAFTIFVGDVQLLLVAPSITAKEHVSTRCCSLTHVALDTWLQQQPLAAGSASSCAAVPPKHAGSCACLCV